MRTRRRSPAPRCWQFRIREGPATRDASPGLPCAGDPTDLPRETAAVRGCDRSFGRTLTRPLLLPGRSGEGDALHVRVQDYGSRLNVPRQRAFSARARLPAFMHDDRAFASGRARARCDTLRRAAFASRRWKKCIDRPARCGDSLNIARACCVSGACSIDCCAANRIHTIRRPHRESGRHSSRFRSFRVARRNASSCPLAPAVDPMTRRKSEC